MSERERRLVIERLRQNHAAAKRASKEISASPGRELCSSASHRRYTVGRLCGAGSPFLVMKGGGMSEINEYVIVRTYSAGVFAGEMVRREGKEVELRNARRIWYWAGAASLSELAQRGTSKPDECKFPIAVDRVILTEVIEILFPTESGRKSIEMVPVWTK